ncbi:MAG: SDR family NAD(P)-dependent oxidoreductase [Gammaproteobacteria bacterium]|nr:SDR family NAD(P)-dependent oxidoreductase [Gammaproteobacteria bacterium]
MPQTLLVTGASAGIGRATAERFLRAGWNVALLARRREALEAMKDQWPNALALPTDVTDEPAVARAFAATTEAFGRIDVLFNNAGRFGPSGLIDEITLEAWQETLSVNLTGMFLCARAAFRQMRTQWPQGGRIINNGSISAHAPRPGSVAYTSTKHAITGLTKTLALDGRPFEIACGQIDIGNAVTEMTAAMASGVRQADGSLQAEDRMDVSHVAEAVFHMASLPLGANVLFTTIMATKMPLVGRG